MAHRWIHDGLDRRVFVPCIGKTRKNHRVMVFFFFVRDTCFFSARQVLDPEMSNAQARSQEWKRLEDEHNKLSKEMRDGGH